MKVDDIGKIIVKKQIHGKKMSQIMNKNNWYLNQMTDITNISLLNICRRAIMEKIFFGDRKRYYYYIQTIFQKYIYLDL